MNGLVVGTSVAIKWFVEEPDSVEAVAVLAHPIAAPDLLAPECANILWNKVGRGERQADEAETIALALEGADITPHSTRPDLTTATQVACALGRTAYDCFHVALAERSQQPLVPADRRLVDAIRADPTRRFAEDVMPLSEFGASASRRISRCSASAARWWRGARILAGAPAPRRRYARSEIWPYVGIAKIAKSSMWKVPGPCSPPRLVAIAGARIGVALNPRSRSTGKYE